MREWAAEIVVGAELARRLVADQFPELELSSLRLLAEGWDNTVWVVDERFAFRFPRREIAVPLVAREIAVLPRLAPLLPLPLPTPIFHGRATRDYPWPFLGGELLSGREAAEAVLDDAGRVALALPLARFLRELHSPAVARAVDAEALPEDPNRRADMPDRVARARRQLEEVERLGLWRVPATVGRTLEAAEELPPSRAATLVHGDLHFRHLLVDDDGALSGVIDWGDVCRADPCIDLQLVWSFLPPDGRAAFLAEYGPVDDEQALRARVLALSLCSALAGYGHQEGLEAVEREALDGLERTTSAA